MKKTTHTEKSIKLEETSPNIEKLEQTMILNQYQKKIPVLAHNLEEHLKLIEPMNILPFILKKHHADDELRESIFSKQIFDESFKDWENQNKIKITNSFSSFSFSKKLQKVGYILKAIKYQDN